MYCSLDNVHDPCVSSLRHRIRAPYPPTYFVSMTGRGSKRPDNCLETRLTRHVRKDCRSDCRDCSSSAVTSYTWIHRDEINDGRGAQRTVWSRKEVILIANQGIAMSNSSELPLVLDETACTVLVFFLLISQTREM
jgi:hypothetical protein